MIRILPKYFPKKETTIIIGFDLQPKQMSFFVMMAMMVSNDTTEDMSNLNTKTTNDVANAIKMNANAMPNMRKITNVLDVDIGNDKNV